VRRTSATGASSTTASTPCSTARCPTCFGATAGLLRGCPCPNWEFVPPLGHPFARFTRSQVRLCVCFDDGAFDLEDALLWRYWGRVKGYSAIRGILDKVV
jgi:hypothetical protein